MIDPSNLVPDEKLGRRVSSRKERKKVESGDTPLSLFVRDGSNKLSVDRLRNDYLREITKISKKYDECRGRNFYGWATVSQDVASRNERQIGISPQTDNPYHADIVLPIIVLSDQEKSDEHASELAANAYWQAPAGLNGKPPIETTSPEDSMFCGRG